MLPHFCALILILCSYCSVFGQNLYRLQGIIQDEEGNPMPSATVVLFHLSDSSITDYVLSNNQGQYQLKGKELEQYELQVSYMGYTSIKKQLILTKDESLTPIVLRESATVLDVAQIEATHIPIRMNGDTLEFNSAAFNVQAHDDVEALLKQMPGVEINDKGQVKVNGKNVYKITIDGKDFFGKNTQIALKNLPADAIKKVQSFDKKTDKEELLGEKASGNSKVLNLVLKDDKKTGYMGNGQGGYGYNPNQQKHHYEGKINLHHFNPKLKISLVGSLNNINEAGMNYAEYSELVGGYMVNKFMRFSNNSSGGLSSLLTENAVGAYRIGTGGINLNLFFSKKTDLSLHYLYHNSVQNLRTVANNYYLLEKAFFARESQGQQQPWMQNHTANIKLTQRIDSTQKLRFRIQYKHFNSSKQKEEKNTLLGADGQLITNQYQEQTSLNKINTFSTNLQYQKKFKKTGRALWMNTMVAYQDQQENWEILSQTQQHTSPQETTVLAQVQDKTQQEQLYGGEVAYVEPLSKRLSLEFSAIAGWHLERLNQHTSDDRGTVLVPNIALSDLYTKHYNYQRFSTKLGVEPKEKRKGIQYDVTLGVQRSQLEGKLNSRNNKVQQVYWFPMVVINAHWNIPKLSPLNMQYATNVREPQVSQLQPLLNNQNPLYVYAGNASLVPEFEHKISFNTFHWDGLTGHHYYFNAGGNLTQNAIVTTQTIDEALRTTIRPINFGNRYNVYAVGSYTGAINKVVEYQLGAVLSWNQSSTFINGLQGKNTTQNYNANASFRNKKTKLIELSLEARANYLHSVVDNNKSLNGAAFNHNYKAKCRVTIAKRWNISTSFKWHVFDNWKYNQRYQLYIWNAETSVTLLKDKSLQLIVRADNLLNQQFMVNRQFLNNGMIETKRNLLGRFIMCSLAYKFNKMGGANNAANNTIMIDESF